MRARHHLVTTLLALAIFAGCESGVPLSPPPTSGPPPGQALPPTGMYGLQAAGDTPLPAAIFDGDVETDDSSFHLRIEVVEGYLEVLPAGRYTQRIIVVSNIDGVPDLAGPVRWNDQGTFASHGGTLRFVSSFIQNVHFEGVYSGGQLLSSQDLLRYFHDVGGATQFRYAR